MKLLLFLLLLIPGLLIAQDNTPSTQLEWIEGARAKIAQLQKEHDEAIAQADAAASASASTEVQLMSLDAQVKNITTERDKWVKYGGQQHDLLLESAKKVEAEKAAILRRDLIITLLTAAIGLWAFLKFWVHVPFL